MNLFLRVLYSIAAPTAPAAPPPPYLLFLNMCGLKYVAPVECGAAIRMGTIYVYGNFMSIREYSCRQRSSIAGASGAGNRHHPNLPPIVSFSLLNQARNLYCHLWENTFHRNYSIMLSHKLLKMQHLKRVKKSCVLK